MHKHIYLAAPYRGSKEEIEARMRDVSNASAYLRRLGIFVTSPLFHHYTFQENDNSRGDYWLDYSESLLTSISLSRGIGVEVELWIMPLEGYDKSEGIKREVEVATRLEIPIKYLKYDWIVNYEYMWLLADTPEAVSYSPISPVFSLIANGASK